MWRAWVNPNGSLARIFVDGEPTPEYSADTHTLIALDDAQLVDAKAGKRWDVIAKQLVDPPPEPAKTPQESAAEAAQARQAAADAYLARMPPAVLDRIADRVAQILAARTRP